MESTPFARYQSVLAPVLSAFVNLSVALCATGLLVAMLGQNPVSAIQTLVEGSIGTLGVLNYTLYYTTSFTFAALAFSIPYRAGLFNIGAEGQAYLAGLGITLWCVYAQPGNAFAMIGGAVLLGAVFAAIWAALPGWLHATNRGNIVITTIMLNFIVYALMTFLLLNFLIRPGQQSPESVRFASSADLLQISDILNWAGFEVRPGPANIMLLGAVAVAVAVNFINLRTVFGLRLHVIGLSERTASYAGIPRVRYAIFAMMLSGAVSSLLAVNELLGVHHRLIQDFVSGYGFVGIAVALMAKGNPLAILASAMLFGALYQGGTELSFQMPGISRDVVVLIQGIIVFVVGAFDKRSRGLIVGMFNTLRARNA